MLVNSSIINNISQCRRIVAATVLTALLLAPSAAIATIENGDYYIKYKGSGKCVSMNKNYSADGQYQFFSQMPCNDGRYHSVFRVTQVRGGSYSVQVRDNQLYMGSASGLQLHAGVPQTSYSGIYWRFNDAGNGYYQVSSSNQCISNYNGSDSDGNALRMFSCNGSDNELFRLEPAGTAMPNDDRWLQATEQIPANHVNIAASKGVTLSSVALNAGGERLVDGERSKLAWSQNSVCHTTDSKLNWAAIDLGSVQPLSAIVIRNRGDSCCRNKFENAQVLVGNSAPVRGTMNSPVLSKFTAGTLGQNIYTGTFPSGTRARFVLLKTYHVDPKPLHLAEIEVYTPPTASTLPQNDNWLQANQQIPAGTINVAQGKQTGMSSVYGGANGSRLVDGQKNKLAWYQGSVAHSNDSNLNWVWIDLGSAQPLRSIVIRNRSDCCQDRFENAQILVGNTPPSNGSLSNPVFSKFTAGKLRSATYSGTFPAGTNARYVLLKTYHNDRPVPMNLAEIEVYANAPAPPPAAFQGPVTPESVSMSWYRWNMHSGPLHHPPADFVKSWENGSDFGMPCRWTRSEGMYFEATPWTGTVAGSAGKGANRCSTGILLNNQIQYVNSIDDVEQANKGNFDILIGNSKVQWVPFGDFKGAIIVGNRDGNRTFLCRQSWPNSPIPYRVGQIREGTSQCYSHNSSNIWQAFNNFQILKAR